jgi:predicted small secreted protein
MKRKIVYLSLSILICCLAVVGCNTTTKQNDDVQTEKSPSTQATDYSQGEHWLALPTELDKNVDVFYLYPTVWSKENESDPIICDIDNPMMLQQSKNAYEKQATAFLDTANIYAPYYRQLDAASALNMTLEEQTDLIKSMPLTDSLAAFEYYIDNYNNGRPFILASHSQGSNVMIYILSDYMKEHPDVYNRMIAAYVIGYSVTDDYLLENPHLKFAQGAEDTGVIISYNTQAPTIEGNDPVVLPGAKVINPISWTTNETLAPASESLGSLAMNSDGTAILNSDGSLSIAKNFADAQVDTKKGVLICSTVDVETYAPGNTVFGKGVFHTFDYPLYYYDLQANATLRTQNYLENHN